MELIAFNRLAKDGVIEGHIKTNGDFYVAGKITGELHLLDQGTLTLEPSGVIEGNIAVHHALILGTVKGNIRATGKVTIKTQAKIEGEIWAQSLEVSPGALLSTQIKIQQPREIPQQI